MNLNIFKKSFFAVSVAASMLSFSCLAMNEGEGEQEDYLMPAQRMNAMPPEHLREAILHVLQYDPSDFFEEFEEYRHAIDLNLFLNEAQIARLYSDLRDGQNVYGGSLDEYNCILDENALDELLIERPEEIQKYVRIVDHQAFMDHLLLYCDFLQGEEVHQNNRINFCFQTSGRFVHSLEQGKNYYTIHFNNINQEHEPFPLKFEYFVRENV